VGSGTASSVPSGLSCPINCSVDLPSHTEVALVASPSARWTGDAQCGGAAKRVCISSLGDAAATENVAFGYATIFISPQASVSGAQGRVVSDPAGVDCDSASGCV